jgi:spore maturation protein CgeB
MSGLIIVGNDGGTNVGASLLRAARSLNLPAALVDASRAYAASRPRARVDWWLRGRRPSRLRAFSREVVRACAAHEPAFLIATGLAPVEREALDRLRSRGVATINYLTDDPWNPAFRSRWFLDALSGYDRVYSPRTRNLDDLRRHGCRQVDYLPFAADPDLFFPEPPPAAELARYASDICFVGAAEAGRVEVIARLLDARVSVALYGDYWDRYAATRPAWRGHAAPDALRRATGAAAVSLCLVRRANRDGHTMRSFEAAAMGACLLVEDTDEHRSVFGGDGEAAVYFRSADDVVDRAVDLLRDDARRRRLAEAARRLVISGRHTYRDRLCTMLSLSSN